MQGVAVWQLFTGATILSPLCISMLWALYNAIPPYLILHFAMFGRVSLQHHQQTMDTNSAMLTACHDMLLSSVTDLLWRCLQWVHSSK